MNRRDFIKLGGVSTLSLLFGFGGLDVVANLPVELAVRGKVYRGTHDGKILISTDGSKTWNLHTNLGSDYSVTKLYAGANNQVQARVGYQKYTFQLGLSKDGKRWVSTIY